MKRSYIVIVSLIMTVVLLTCFTLLACDKKDDKGTYVIQYTDDSGVHTLEVTKGMPYSISSIPKKEGYEFIGLYDSEEGGTRYVSSSGSSLSVFDDKRNVVLFPRFQPKEFALMLDFQGSSYYDSTQSIQYTVKYDQSLPKLPLELTKPNYHFIGWFTEPKGQGLQVSDARGNYPLISVVNVKNFGETLLEDNAIRLYAAFEGDSRTVVFHADDNREELQIPYGTQIKDVTLSFRKNNQAVVSWSKTGSIQDTFDGAITENIELYAVDWAPFIEFDSLGGNEVAPIVAKAGQPIVLPDIVKKDYSFKGWYTEDGDSFVSTTMPDSSTRLYARWDSIISFDARGGSSVQKLIASAGDSITLPETQKDGYYFGGWYDKDGKKFEEQTMPSNSLTLYAKYYSFKTRSLTLLDKEYYMGGSNRLCEVGDSDGFREGMYQNISLSNCVVGCKVTVKFSCSYRSDDADVTYNAGVYLLDQNDKVEKSASLYNKLIFVDSQTKELSFTTDVNISSNKIVVAYYGEISSIGGFMKISGPGGFKLYFGNSNITITYPDATTLN